MSGLDRAISLDWPVGGCGDPALVKRFTHNGTAGR
jgi:hypothetical protein